MTLSVTPSKIGSVTPSKIVLVPGPRDTAARVSAAQVRRYRLARLRLDGRAPMWRARPSQPQRS